jgi:hypothetical protein
VCVIEREGEKERRTDKTDRREKERDRERVVFVQSSK